jgi:hypothetical protein
MRIPFFDRTSVTPSAEPIHYEAFRRYCLFLRKKELYGNVRALNVPARPFFDEETPDRVIINLGAGRAGLGRTCGVQPFPSR